MQNATKPTETHNRGRLLVLGDKYRLSKYLITIASAYFCSNDNEDK